MHCHRKIKVDKYITQHNCSYKNSSMQVKHLKGLKFFSNFVCVTRQTTMTLILLIFLPTVTWCLIINMWLTYQPMKRNPRDALDSGFRSTGYFQNPMTGFTRIPDSVCLYDLYGFLISIIVRFGISNPLHQIQIVSEFHSTSVFRACKTQNKL